MSKRARATAIPEAVQPEPPGWRDLPNGADYVVDGVALVTVRPAVSNDPRSATWTWALANGRSGRHIGGLDSAKARALDQHQRHG